MSKDKCTNLQKLLEVEREVIERHIDMHKWCNHIENREEAICDFIKKYAWLMKEMYCGTQCDKKEECNLAKEFISKSKKEDPTT